MGKVKLFCYIFIYVNNCVQFCLLEELLKMMLRPTGGSRWKRIDPRIFGSLQNRENTSLAFKLVQGWLGDRYIPDDGHEMGWLEDFKEFSADTSAHGVKYVFHGNQKFIKLLFLFLWVASIGYAVYVIATSAVSFIGKPTGTKFQVNIRVGGK